MPLEKRGVERFYSEFESLYRDHKKSAKILLYYLGDFDEPFYNAISARLEKLLSKQNFSNIAIRRFMSVFIEAAQNIRIHAIKDSEQNLHAGILIWMEEGKLYSTFGNIVSRKQGENLIERYGKVNEMSRNELKNRYMELIKNGEYSDRGGAGLGIITVILKSRNSCRVNVLPLNEDFACFNNTIIIDL